MNTLLVPTDFSPVADQALSYAIQTAKHYSLDVTLFHVVLLSTPSISNAVYVDVNTDFQKQAEEQLKEKMEGLQQNHPEVKFSMKVETGLFLDSLERYAASINPLAIVMGITGEGSTLDKLIGSNAILAMQHITFPLMVIPKQASFQPVKHMGFACDLKHVANSTPLLAIKAFNKLFDATLHILNIDFKNRHFTADTPAELATLNQMFEGLNTQYHFVESDQIQEALHDFVEKQHIDVLIMVPRKHNFFESLFRKSQTREMLYHSRVPILALHQPS